MPTGIYVRTKESNKKRSLTMKKRWKDSPKLNNKERGEKLRQKALLQWSNMSKQQRIEHTKNAILKRQSTKGMTYFEIFGTDNPGCGFQRGENNIMKNPEMREKASSTLLKTMKLRPELGFQKGEANVAKTPRVRKLLRIKAIERIEKQVFNGFPMNPAIGKDETKILDKLEKQYKYKILRQYRVAGYFLDGYIPELNLAFEVDESDHFNKEGNLYEGDIIRQQIIENEINCKFVRMRS